jgi:ligand-binding SRPBCC domain-containing protein
MQSASQTNETAIDGVTSGLIGLNETVTWRGKHFGLYLTHTSKIIEYESPINFTDVMIKGHFKYFIHQHFFEEEDGKTLMTDVLKYKTPFGVFGKCFDSFFLRKHLHRFLSHRNKQLKDELE